MKRETFWLGLFLMMMVTCFVSDAAWYVAGKRTADRWWQNHIIEIERGEHSHSVAYELVGVQRCVGMDYVKNGEVYIYRIVLDGGKCIPNSGWAH